jgi:hypothetical protein
LNLVDFFERCRQAPARVLMLDYDGTLAPFQVRPDRALPYSGVTELLDDIMMAERSRIVIVSGRPIRELLPLLNLPSRPELWGAHGWERLRPDGSTVRVELHDAARRSLEEGERLVKCPRRHRHPRRSQARQRRVSLARRAGDLGRARSGGTLAPMGASRCARTGRVAAL